MEKPLLLVREEFMSDLADLINQSRLPFVIIEPILEKFLENARGAIKQQLSDEKFRYEKYLKEKEKEASEENSDKQNIQRGCREIDSP